MIHVTTEDTIWKMFGTHPAIRCPLAKVVEVPRSEQAMLVAHDVVPDEIIRHTNDIDTDTLASICTFDDAGWALGPTSAKSIIPHFAYDSIVANHIIHLITILNIDANTSILPEHVRIGQTFVSSVDGDPRLERIYNGISLKHTRWAFPSQVEV
jgi:hypothetical protein